MKSPDNPEDAEYEFRVLQEISKAHPETFTIPRPIELIKRSEQTILVMEWIEGNEIQSQVDQYLLFKDKSALTTFTCLGQAFRELHAMDVGESRNSFLPTSESRLKEETIRLSRTVPVVRVRDVVAQRILRSRGLDERIFQIVNLHGESYFSHIMMRDKKFVFVDFNKTCRGPAFFDLATLDVSLYCSLLLPARTPKSLDPLVTAFWRGYLKGEPHEETMRLGEAYVALRGLEDLFLGRGSLKNSSLKGKIGNSLKMRKLQNLVNRWIQTSSIDQQR